MALLTIVILTNGRIPMSGETIPCFQFIKIKKIFKFVPTILALNLCVIMMKF